MSNEEVDDEIILPGIVGGPGAGPGLGLATDKPADEPANEPTEPEVDTDDEEQLEDVEETMSERVIGLMEMMPDKFWVTLGRSLGLGYWLVRRGGWVLGTSMALLVLPPLLESQRLEFEEMQNMQKKQMLLGPGSMTPPLQSPR